MIVFFESRALPGYHGNADTTSVVSQGAKAQASTGSAGPSEQEIRAKYADMRPFLVKTECVQVRCVLSFLFITFHGREV